MKVISFVILIFLVFSCKKAEDRNCVKSIGSNTSKEILLDNFDHVFMGGHIKYKLIQDDVNKVVINGGENIIGEIEASVESNKLTIKNNNKCAFLRSYEEVIEVEIHFVNIININFEGTHEVVCSDTINTTDLTLVIRDGAGAFDLKLNANSLTLVITHGWGNYTVSGDVNYATFQISSNGNGNSNKLNVSTDLVVISNSAGLVEVNADNANFFAETNSLGNINYIGVPNLISFNRYGEGDLIDNN